MHPQLAAIQQQIDEATSRARRLGEAAGDRAFRQRPREASWSIGECLEHLNLTTRAYLPLIDDALARQPSAPVPDSYRYRRDPLGWLLCWMLEPPSRLKVKTGPSFEPATVEDRHVVMDEFVALQEALSARVAASAGRDLNRIRVVSPFNARMRYNLYSAFSAVLAHERRHLWQAERSRPRR